jgi:hypothetical protein
MKIIGTAYNPIIEFDFKWEDAARTCNACAREIHAKIKKQFLKYKQ